MKIKGISTPPKHSSERVVFKREGDICLVFDLVTVTNYEEFKAICQPPKPFFRQYPDGRQEPVFDDPEFQKQQLEYAQRQTNWTFLKSIAATAGLEWETVNMGDPATWGNYENELEQWLTVMERTALLNAFIRVNSVTEESLKAARDAFLSGALKELHTPDHSPVQEPTNIQFGEPVSVSASDPQA